jgi:hypothetical protein
MGSGIITPCILYFFTKWTLIVSFMAGLFHSQGKSHWFPLDTMLDALQTVGHCGDKKNRCPYREANPSFLVVKSLA